jgi:hypothetical protein
MVGVFILSDLLVIEIEVVFLSFSTMLYEVTIGKARPKC